MKTHLTLAAIFAVFALGGPASAADRNAQDFVYLSDKGPLLLRFHVYLDGKPLVQKWEKFMGKLFAYLDRNGDGILSKDEAAGVPPAEVLFNSTPNYVGQRPNLPETLDENRDGKVTRTELANWYRSIGATPFQILTDSAQAGFSGTFVGYGQSQPLPAEALNQRLFDLLDANKDSKLSREELSRAPAILHKLDLNDDEMVSALELSGGIEKEADDSGNVVVAFTSDGQLSANGPFVPVKAGHASKELARRLLDRYGGKGKKAAEKKLTRRDLGIDEASFKRLDQDEDGKLDREELARFSERPPDLELRVRLGKRSNAEHGIEEGKAAIEVIPSPLAKSIRPAKGDSLMLELGNLHIEMGLAGISSEMRFKDILRQQYLGQFRMADKDNNGYLDKDESMRSPFYRNTFRTMDRDGDGKLFEKEVLAYLDKMKELQEAAVRSCASLSVNDKGRGLFDLADANNDGRLGIRDMRQMVQLIAQLDRDSDEQINRDEIPHQYRMDVHLGPPQGNPFGSGKVVIVSKTFVAQQPKAPKRSGPVWFQKMDRNHDGDVSRREFLGTDAEFRKIDRDGDGLISTEEAKRADERFRKQK